MTLLPEMTLATLNLGVRAKLGPKKPPTFKSIWIERWHDIVHALCNMSKQIELNKQEDSWLCQAWARQNSTANGPQRVYHVGHQIQDAI